nr:CAAD domain-containing protein [Xenococcus sp. MO_188.B8]
VRVILAVLAAINDFPLLAPLFELIGLGYTTWFVYRYLWKESSRKELKDEFEVLKSQVMGRNS